MSMIALFLVWLAIVSFMRAYRIWIFYYVMGATGCAYWLVLVGRTFFQVEMFLAGSSGWVVHQICSFLGVPTRIFDRAPEILMVLVGSQDLGWTIFRIGVESSGLLEMSVLISLLLFYPGWSLRQRGRAILLGLIASWIANILRILQIIFILHILGKESLVIAHSFIGKAVFFFMTVGIYWYLITTPTIRTLRQSRKSSEK